MEDKKTNEILLEENEGVPAQAQDETPSSSDTLNPAEIGADIKVLSPSRQVLKRFFRSKLSIIGLGILIFLFLFAFIGPFLSPWGEIDIDESQGAEKFLAQRVEFVGEDGETYIIYYATIDVLQQNKLDGPSLQHWLGTDENGMDVLTRLMYGGRISLTLGFVVVILATLLGVFFGSIAGYFGKWADMIIMRIVDIFSCVPTIPILLIVSALLNEWQVPGNVRIYYLMIFLTIFSWSGIARVVRGQILSLREQEFMIAAEALGLPVWRRIFSHLIPNIMPQLIVIMTLSLGSIILTEATLSYLNLGVPLPNAAWGSMINAATKPEILENYFHVWVPPGICIVLAVLGFNFVGDGLRDAFDPKGRR